MLRLAVAGRASIQRLGAERAGEIGVRGRRQLRGQLAECGAQPSSSTGR